MARILQVATVDISVGKLLLPLIDALRSSGHDVDVACALTDYAAHLHRRGFNLIEVKMERKAISAAHCRAFLKFLWLMKRKEYDIVHVHTPIASLLGRAAARLAGVPAIIYTAHGFYFHENMNWLLRLTIVMIEKTMGRRATDWLFTQSNEDAGFARAREFLRDDRILCIGNGVDVDSFALADSAPALRECFGIQAHAKVVGFVGRLVKEKGIIELLEAFSLVAREFPNAKLLVVGAALSSDRDRQTTEIVQSIIKTEKLHDSVILTGFREDIPDLLSIMDLFVLPSYREGMPRTILEAMAAGKAVIATNIRGCREEVIHGETGFLVPPKDSSSLASAIAKLLSDEDMRLNMGHAGQARAREYYDERKVIDRQLAVYREILEKNE